MVKKRERFYFDKRWVRKPEAKEVIRSEWEPDCIDSPMFKVANKTKRCRMELIKWNKQ